MAKFKQKVLALTDEHAKYLTKVTPIDTALQFLFLRFLPAAVTPNQITVFRFVTVPFIIVLLLGGQYPAATILFFFSALSDALDGALARTTKRITRWGILADPLADKLLIASVAIILISRFLGWTLALAIVFLETVNVASAYYRYKGKVIPAKTTGKVKMVLQCVGVIFLFFYVLFGGAFWLPLAFSTLILAVVFAILSLLVYKSV